MVVAVLVSGQVRADDDLLRRRLTPTHAADLQPPSRPLDLFRVVEQGLDLPRPRFHGLAEEADDVLDTVLEHARVLETREERCRPVPARADDHGRVVPLRERRREDLDILFGRHVPCSLATEDALVCSDV